MSISTLEFCKNKTKIKKTSLYYAKYQMEHREEPFYILKSQKTLAFS